MALLYLKKKIFRENIVGSSQRPSSSSGGARYSALTNFASSSSNNHNDADPENGPAFDDSSTLNDSDNNHTKAEDNDRNSNDDDFGSKETFASIISDYFTSSGSRFFYNLTLGLSDGLTVPFALSAGLTRFGDPAVVRYGGLAEVVAGCISMGVGGFMSSKGEVDTYRNELKNVRRLVQNSPQELTLLIHETFERYKLSNEVMTGLVDHFKASPDQAVDFILTFHHDMAVDTTSRLVSVLSGFTVALGYVLGGMLPLLPYFVHSTLDVAFAWSLTIMIVVLLAFGFTRSWYTEGKDLKKSIKSSLLFLFTGGAAVSAAIACTKLIPHE